MDKNSIVQSSAYHIIPGRRKRRGMEPDDLLCSRNARPQKALARAKARLGVSVGGRARKPRAVEDHSAPIPEERTCKLGGIIIDG